MGNLSDPGRSQGDIMARLEELERRVEELQTTRRLPGASIGSGGLRVLDGGNIAIDGGNLIITEGRLIAGDPEGARAEVTETGYRVFNEDGQIIIDLTTTGNNQMLLRGTGDDNEILLSQTGEINGRVLNAEQINVDGKPLDSYINDFIEEEDPAPPPATTITRTYEAIWSRAYRQNGEPNRFVPGNGLTQGRYSGTNGNQRSLIGFPTSQIQADHGGRTITRVRVYLYYYHWYFNGGGTAVLGHHNHTSAPGSFSASAIDVLRSSDWPKPGSRWVTYTAGEQDWATGAKTGIVLGPGPSTSRTFYGVARAHDQSNPPRIEIRSTG